MLIFVVDDEPDLTEMLQRTLSREGFDVVTFDSAKAALEYAATHLPDLIISDVSMPEMDGFEFRRQYQARFLHRRTPFAFLSALGDSANVVHGLDSGAEDYLVKPVPTSVLVAKVRSMLRRSSVVGCATFRGELAELPIANVLQYCEQRGLTGTVEFVTSRGAVTVSFEAGRLDVDDVTGDQLTELVDERSGSFRIVSRPISFDAIESSRAGDEEQGAPSRTSMPMGRLSGVRLGSRLLQLQTEYEPPPSDQVVTVVILDGRVLRKQETRRDPGESLDAVRSRIDAQHEGMEQYVREKMSQRKAPAGGSAPGGDDPSATVSAAPPVGGDAADEPTAAAPQSAEDKSSLWKRGLELYRQGKLAECLPLLEQALALDPSDSLLRANLDTVRRRLGTSGNGAS